MFFQGGLIMNEINQTNYNQAAAAYAKQTDAAKETTTEKTDKKRVSGNTYGDATLSDKAAKYYEKLTKKYGNLNFVLVASDKKEEAQAKKSSFADSSKLTVLIDTDKIEKMAEDEAYRAKYEGVLASAASGISQMKTQLGSMASNVKAYGMTVNDNGTAKYFAVIDKSLSSQKERIEKNAKKKAEEKKTEAKAAKKAEAEKLKEQSEDDDSITIEANSIEELMKKIQDYYMSSRSDEVQTEEEKKVGQSFDYSV